MGRIITVGMKKNYISSTFELKVTLIKKTELTKNYKKLTETKVTMDETITNVDIQKEIIKIVNAYIYQKNGEKWMNDRIQNKKLMKDSQQSI